MQYQQPIQFITLYVATETCSVSFSKLLPNINLWTRPGLNPAQFVPPQDNILVNSALVYVYVNLLLNFNCYKVGKSYFCWHEVHWNVH